MIHMFFKTLAPLTVLIHLFSFQGAGATEKGETPLSDTPKAFHQKESVHPGRITKFLDKLPVVSHYRNLLRNDSMIFGRHICRGTTIGLGCLATAYYLLTTKRDVLHRNSLVTSFFFFGAATTYLSPRTSGLIKHGLTFAISSTTGAAFASVGTIALVSLGGYFWFFENFKK